MPLGLERRQNTGQLHFITFSCYYRLPYLESAKSKDILEQVIERTRRSHNFTIYAYVLMPEHVHLLLSEPERHQLSSTIRVLKGESSKLLKGTGERSWQPRTGGPYIKPPTPLGAPFMQSHRMRGHSCESTNRSNKMLFAA
ncbi:transposase [Tunturibacter empetritectus]|uniref:REP element-mobilizing transposase RayT n=1 Tax=Tunturiibacter empetritectus TaxID=3069691 RepID=A0A7W8MS82_9BACT|nr:transposase [Edaphobacter lichenicola]MBB5316919.1 REP element-mobilizing transposase RayT [Edaphobacter lichenicola]